MDINVSPSACFAKEGYRHICGLKLAKKIVREGLQKTASISYCMKLCLSMKKARDVSLCIVWERIGLFLSCGFNFLTVNRCDLRLWFLSRAACLWSDKIRADGVTESKLDSSYWLVEMQKSFTIKVQNSIYMQFSCDFSCHVLKTFVLNRYRTGHVSVFLNESFSVMHCRISNYLLKYVTTLVVFPALKDWLLYKPVAFEFALWRTISLVGAIELLNALNESVFWVS